jgi:hypothetical protein
VHRENYHAVMGTDVLLPKQGTWWFPHQQRGPLQDIVFRTRLVYMKSVR